MIDLEQERYRAAATRSYVTPAIITLVLYFVFWLPGIIANIMYWKAASRDQQLAGRAPEGKNYLGILLVIFGVLPAALLTLLLVLGILGMGLFAAMGGQ